MYITKKFSLKKTPKNSLKYRTMFTYCYFRPLALYINKDKQHFELVKVLVSVYSCLGKGLLTSGLPVYQLGSLRGLKTNIRFIHLLIGDLFFSQHAHKMCKPLTTKFGMSVRY